MKKPIYLTDAGRRCGEPLEACGTMRDPYKRSIPLPLKILSIDEDPRGFLKVVTRSASGDHKITHAVLVN